MVDTNLVAEISKNIVSALAGQGLSAMVGHDSRGNGHVQSVQPLTVVAYTGESFEYTHGERPGYSEAAFSLTTRVACKDPQEDSGLVHWHIKKIKDAITVESLNSGALTTTKNVSRVEIGRVDVAHEDARLTISCSVGIRYRY